jgi:hypothetical protein
MNQNLPELNRRQFVTGGVALGAAAAVVAPASAAATSATQAQATADPNALRWLDGAAPATHAGLAWGLPWARGQFKKGQAFALRDAQGAAHALQTWPLAYWPDGSLKWTGHAVPPAVTPGVGWAVQGASAAPTSAGPAVSVEESADAITIDTGVIRCVLPRKGAVLVASVQRAGVEILRGARLVAVSDDRAERPGAESTPTTQATQTTRTTQFDSDIERVTVEQRGPQRAVVRISGQHRQGTRAWLPFDLRLYLHAGGEAIRVMHSFVFDGDPQRDFIRGLGLRFNVPLRDAPHDRHIRFSGEQFKEGPGLWAECVRGLTGLRRDPGAAVRAAQLEGRACPPVDTFHPSVKKYLERIPAWGDYSLLQLAPDSFEIRKRTQPGHTWVHAAWGRRASGLGYVGGASGGVAFGLRDFWQRHPVQLDVRGAHTAAAEVTVWLLSPEAQAQDLRPYHDGMGMQTHAQQLEGLEVTYEDWETGFDTSVGAGRSSEITLFALAATPTRERTVQLANLVQTPPQIVASPQFYKSSGVFGNLWALPDRSSAAKAAIEDKLDFLFDFYKREVEQRHWTGFWDYGDIRHTYDADRHEWRYDVGGYAWDNSELSPDLWLWSAYLRSGRADIFRFAEAQVRHTSEVDTYHLGRFKGLGTRHGVQHWSDSAKQLRISTAAYRRHYHYLTTDERIGDVLHELRGADQQLLALDPARKIVPRPPKGPGNGLMGVGTDWGSMTANWLTEWERTGDTRWRDRIRRGMESVAGMPHGFFSAATSGYDAATGELFNVQGQKVSASHLSAVFGLVEMMDEVIALIDVPGFEKAWVQYCTLYNAPAEEQRRVLGSTHGGTNALTVGHSRLSAWAAWRTNDAALARRAWAEFNGDRNFGRKPIGTQRVVGPAVLYPVDEAPWVSTNDAAQWSLAAIQNLALIGQHLAAE